MGSGSARPLPGWEGWSGYCVGLVRLWIRVAGRYCRLSR